MVAAVSIVIIIQLYDVQVQIPVIMPLYATAQIRLN